MKADTKRCGEKLVGVRPFRWCCLYYRWAGPDTRVRPQRSEAMMTGFRTPSRADARKGHRGRPRTRKRRPKGRRRRPSPSHPRAAVQGLTSSTLAEAREPPRLPRQPRAHPRHQATKAPEAIASMKAPRYRGDRSRQTQRRTRAKGRQRRHQSVRTKASAPISQRRLRAPRRPGRPKTTVRGADPAYGARQRHGGWIPRHAVSGPGRSPFRGLYQPRP